MAESADFYPPSPPDIPTDLTRPPFGYRLRVVVVLASLVLFALLYITLVAGSAYLSFWAFASAAQDSPSEAGALKVIPHAARTEEHLVNKYNEAVQKRQRGQITDDQMLQILEHEIVPGLQAERQTLAKTKNLSSEERQLVERMDRAFGAQEEAWQLLIKAVRTNNVEIAQQAHQKMQNSEMLERLISSDISNYYSRLPRKSSKDDSPFWFIVIGVLSALFCLFLVKGFFKWRPTDSADRLEITPEEQPVLFAFVRQVCHDTRAPMPRHIDLTAEVNAAVFYHESILNLILPARKNLIIGLGLINQLNLSEFKAVLGHEFGHFSQNSMKLGTYVYMSNRVIGDIVYRRDWLDDTVASLCRIDIRIAVFAWGFSAGLWSLRKSLQGLFRVINFANSDLSRQMEFNADLVAVSVAGSDALVHGLARLEFASEALGQAWSDVSTAADHQLFSSDLFFHQSKAAEYLRALGKQPATSIIPPLPDNHEQAVQIFQPEDTSVPKMWARHPSNYLRELNAKKQYIRGSIDDRSPWILFHEPALVGSQITKRLYLASRKLEDVKLEDPEVVQTFIDAEHSETTYHPRYHGLYDRRYLTPGDLDKRFGVELATPNSSDNWAEAHAELYGAATIARMAAHNVRSQEQRRLASLVGGQVELTGKDFEFRGNRHRRGDAKQLLDQVQKELDQDFEWMSNHDQESLRIHHGLAAACDEATRHELEARYRFHMALQDMQVSLAGHNHRVRSILAFLSDKRKVPEDDFKTSVRVFVDAHAALRQALEKAAQLRLPPMKNLTAGAPLAPLLLSEPLIGPLPGGTNTLDGKWIGAFIGQLGGVLDHIERIYFKSLGGILALQERIAEQGLKPRAAAVPQPQE